jgi:hypothetical protein
MFRFVIALKGCVISPKNVPIELYLEPSWTSVMISTFGLDWFNNESGTRITFFHLSFQMLFNLCQASLILSYVFFDVLFQRIFVPWKISDWPIKKWHINLSIKRTLNISTRYRPRNAMLGNSCASWEALLPPRLPGYEMHWINSSRCDTNLVDRLGMSD